MKPHASTFATAEDASLGLEGPAPSSEATRIRLLPLLLAIGLTLFVGQFAFLFPAMKLGMPPGLASVTLQSQAFFTIAFAAIALRVLRQVSTLRSVRQTAWGG